VCMVVPRDCASSDRESERLHESAVGVGNRKVYGFTTDYALVDAFEVPEVRWRT
jgi:hypothetical protein